MTKMRNLLPILLISPILACILLVGYWVLVEEHIFPADVITGSAWSEPMLVKPGDTIKVFYTLDTRRDCPRSFTSWVTNGIVTTFEDSYGHQTEAAGQRVLSYKVKLPNAIELGTHVYHVRGTWNCNPIASQVIHYPEITFEVIE